MPSWNFDIDKIMSPSPPKSTSKGILGIQAWGAKKAPCEAASPPKHKHSKWLNRFLNPFSGLRVGKRSKAVSRSELDTDAEKSTTMCLRETAASAAPHEESAMSSCIVAVASSSTALVCQADVKGEPEDVLAIADLPPKQPSFEKQLRDGLVTPLTAPPAPWAPAPALGTVAGFPEAQAPALWSGRGEALPIELLDEDDAPGFMFNTSDRAAHMQPALPADSAKGGTDWTEPALSPVHDMEPTVRPSTFRSHCPLSRRKPSLEIPEAPVDQSSKAPSTVVSPQASDMQSSALALSSDYIPGPRAEKGRKLCISISSRPTSAGGDSAPTTGSRVRSQSCSTTSSWRSEFTPAGMSADGGYELKQAASLRPVPMGVKKKPPLPPLPAKPPENGSVASKLPLTGKGASGQLVPSSPVADDAALRRISKSANAKMAMPPPFGPRGRRADESPTASTCGDNSIDKATESDTTLDVGTEGFDESERPDFSELALSFACMA